MAERQNTAVLPAGSCGKTVEVKASGGSNPSLSAGKGSDLSGPFMFYTYILRSLKDGGYYFGYCSDMRERLNRHNAGKVRSTKARTPFLLHYHEEFNTKSEAFKREMFFKSFDGRQWLKLKDIL